MLAVLRLGHRPGRDKRTTTHLGLTARALGADRLILTRRDPEVEASLAAIQDRWGAGLAVEVRPQWRPVIRDWKGTKVHLTMYGEHLDEVVPRIPRGRDLLVVVGAEKVPPEVYQLVDHNIAVGHQPHSEVAALAVFLDRFLVGAGLRRPFDGQLRIIGSPRGKRVAASPGRPLPGAERASSNQE